MNRIAATAAAAALLGTAAHAQDQGLTVEDVRAFLEPLSENAEQSVESGDWKGVQNWLAMHVADDAPLYVTGEILMSGGPSTTFTSSLRGADMKDYAQSSLMGFQTGAGGDAVQDYTLEVRIMDIWQMPGGFVSAAVAFYEHGEIVPPEGMEESVPVSGPFASATECALRMGGSAETPVIELANCKIDANV